jgi:hypothetical protein
VRRWSGGWVLLVAERWECAAAGAGVGAAGGVAVAAADVGCVFERWRGTDGDDVCRHSYVVVVAGALGGGDFAACCGGRGVGDGDGNADDGHLVDG